MKQLDGIKLTDAKALLRDMRKYADMTKKLGKRGQSLFMKQLLGQQAFRVEYFPALGESGAWAQAEGVLLKSFGVTAKKSEIEFIESSTLKGGMKVYCDDNMVDLSFKKIESLIQK